MPALFYPALTTEGWELRPWQQTDLATLVAAGHDLMIQRYRTSLPRDDAAAQDWWERAGTEFATGRRLELAIVDRSTAVVVGSVSLESFEQRNAMVSFWLLPGAPGRGVMTSVLSALTAWALADLALARLAALVDPDNAPSQNVVLRCGFVLEGRLRSHWTCLTAGESIHSSTDWSTGPDDRVAFAERQTETHGTVVGAVDLRPGSTGPS